jgi:hypothetical protein
MLKHQAHGTNIATVIHRGAPSATLTSVKLHTDREKVSVQHLCEALRYCAAREDIQIINISMGILADRVNAELYDACRRCHEAGKLIVAAAHYDSSKLCYPAALPFVWGVGTGITRDASQFMYLGEGYINVLAKGIHQRMLGEDFRPAIRDGTSYAAAAFAAIAANLLQQHGRLPAVAFRALVQRRSKDIYSVHYPVHAGRADTGQPAADLPLPESGRVMVYPQHDAWVQTITGQKAVTMVMQCPVDPEGEYNVAVSPAKRCIPGILSHKLCENIDALALGVFFRNRFLINIYFGYSLIDLMLKNNRDFILADAYLYHVVKRRAQDYPGFSGAITLLGQTYSNAV